jgi:hypothetical protein
VRNIDDGRWWAWVELMSGSSIAGYLAVAVVPVLVVAVSWWVASRLW